MVKKPSALKRLAGLAKWRGKKFRDVRDAVKRHGATGEYGGRLKPLGPKMVRFGRHFLASFPEKTLQGKKRLVFATRVSTARYESPVAIRLNVAKRTKAGKPPGLKLGEAKLSFEKKAVVVEALQGAKGKQADLERFRLAAGMPWANYLLKEIEEHASATGFKEVKIRAPETLKYYDFPMAGGEYAKLREGDRIRYGMLRLYGKAAKARGFKRNGNFFVKSV